MFFLNQQQNCTECWWQWVVLAVPLNAVEVVEQKSQAILSRWVAEMVSDQGGSSETMEDIVEKEEAREGAEEATIPSHSWLGGRHTAPPASWGSRAAEESPFNSHRKSEAWSKHFLCIPDVTLASNKLVTQEIFGNCSDFGLKVSAAGGLTVWGWAGFAPCCLALCYSCIPHADQ